MTIITCPICDGPVEVSAAEPEPACQVGHDFSDDDLPRQIDNRATHALWAAVRALDDQAATARWRTTRPDPPRYMDEVASTAKEHADLLRQLLQRREGSPS